jgi:hypothetical protein
MTSDGNFESDKEAIEHLLKFWKKDILKESDSLKEKAIKILEEQLNELNLARKTSLNEIKHER